MQHIILNQAQLSELKKLAESLSGVKLTKQLSAPLISRSTATKREIDIGVILLEVIVQKQLVKQKNLKRNQLTLEP